MLNDTGLSTIPTLRSHWGSFGAKTAIGLGCIWWIAQQSLVIVKADHSYSRGWPWTCPAARSAKSTYRGNDRCWQLQTTTDISTWQWRWFGSVKSVEGQHSPSPSAAEGDEWRRLTSSRIQWSVRSPRGENTFPTWAVLLICEVT